MTSASQKLSSALFVSVLGVWPACEAVTEYVFHFICYILMPLCMGKKNVVISLPLPIEKKKKKGEPGLAETYQMDGEAVVLLSLEYCKKTF